MMRISISSLLFNMKHKIRCWSLKTFAVVLPNDSCHYVKSVRIRNYSGPHFAAFGLNTERHYDGMFRNYQNRYFLYHSCQVSLDWTT